MSNSKSALKDIGSIFGGKSDGPLANVTKYTNVTGNNLLSIP